MKKKRKKGEISRCLLQKGGVRMRKMMIRHLILAALKRSYLRHLQFQSRLPSSSSLKRR